MDAQGSLALSVVIPIYNEEENIPELTSRLNAALSALNRSYEIILVDDGSRDNSYNLLKEVARANPRIRVVRFKRNYGQTAAMAAGFKLSRGQVILPMDGDLQNDPQDIGKLLAKMEEGYDVVSGWRVNRQDKFLSRLLPSRIANWIISRISGVRLHDYGCTLKAYRREVIAPVQLYGEMHRFIPIFASWNGARITELPVAHHERTRGTSKYGLNRTFKVILDLIVIKFYETYSQKPIHVFGGFGLFSIFLALLSGVWAIVLKYFFDKPFVETPLPLLTVLLTMMGIMSVLMGVLAEMIMRTYYESQAKPIYSIQAIIESDPNQCAESADT